MSKYNLVFFDYQLDAFGANQQLIQATIQNLLTGIYKNRSLILSTNTLLVTLFDSDFTSYPYPKECVEDVLSDEWQKTKGIDYDFSSIHIYVVPIQLEDIASQLSRFQREIKFLNALKEK